ncbi:hypothetical protein ASU80_17870 [Enterobacter hormaechei subsp. xiangfangensis]|nr:hypothetical protein ASV11_14915 [Enterobacter hormaechei subsp. xiangfangensis]KTJ64626.1 hypothetical protein ASU80_17870 [Enterobacter hormaechei subsp. xiangfangensis]
MNAIILLLKENKVTQQLNLTFIILLLSWFLLFIIQFMDIKSLHQQIISKHGLVLTLMILIVN